MLLDGGRMTDAEHDGATSCRRSSTARSTSPGVRTIREEVFGPHVALDPVPRRRRRGRGSTTTRSTACRWR